MVTDYIQGRTALVLAARNGHAETVKVLLQAGADTTRRPDSAPFSVEIREAIKVSGSLRTKAYE